MQLAQVGLAARLPVYNVGSMKLLLVALCLAAQPLCFAETRPAIPPVKEAEAPDKTPRAGAGIRYEGGDGSSVEKAVIIKGAKESQAGIRAEYGYLKKAFPGYKLRQQSLQAKGGKKYDVLAITTKEGKDLDVFFDISDFFGKF